jgi:ethanolamine ammonia-lyase small subunit
MTDRPASPPIADSWLALRRHTPARIAIGRAGFGLPTHAHLDFQAAHARARDAVHAGLDVAALARDIAACGLGSIAVRSAAPDRLAFLKRPDLGRTLAPESVARLSEPMVAPDVVIVVGDGLSSVAAERHAVAVLGALCPRLTERSIAVAPVVIATQARVALADQIGELLQARLSIILLGERPGLSAADSLGIYLTYAPRVGRLDSERNCISNVRAEGMSAQDAAVRAFDLVQSMFVHGASGVPLALKRARKGAPHGP